jgi:linoleoyl-CoA desaturase
MNYTKVKFVNKAKSNFFGDLRENIDAYFDHNNLSKFGGNQLIFKAIFMISLYIIPYFLMLFLNLTGWQMFGLCIVMGLGVAGVGMSVMHDAIHGSFSKYPLVNKVFGATLYFLGGNVYNWDVQHNKLHHTYTNVHGIDEDITGKPFLRLSYEEKHRFIHRFQHFYAFFLYSLMTISFLWKDFKEIYLYNKMASSGIVKAFPRKELITLFITKVVYVLFIFGLPIYLTTNITIGEWAIGFMAMHLTAGLILSTVFQLAHVVEGATDQPAPDEKGTIENAWAIHQLLTTANFAGKNKVLSWYIGGLDYQVEHHLFPNISHIHYPAISKIVKETASKYGIPYNDKGSFNTAVVSHIRMLRNIGNDLKAA